MGKLFIVSAPSGTGKTTLVTEAIKKLSEEYNISRVITYTTRTPRDGEINGKDYHFVSQDDFTNKLNNNFFLEDTTYANKPYASPASIKEELELGKHLILVIDRDGVKSIKSLLPSTTIWIAPPNIEILRSRIKGRNTESHTQMQDRLELAKQEINDEKKQPIFEYHIINDNFDKALQELIAIIKAKIK